MPRPQSGNFNLIGLLTVALILLGALSFVFLSGSGDDFPVDSGDEPAVEQPEVEAGTFDGQTPTTVDRGPAEAGPSRVAQDTPTSLDDYGDEVGGLVSGMVVNDQGRPIANATIAVSQRFSAGTLMRGYGDGDDERLTAVTDAGGRYRFRELAAEIDMNMWVYHEDYAPVQAPPFQALKREAQELPPVVLKSGYVVTGSVKDTAGNPLQAQVVLRMQARDAFRSGSPEEQAADDRRLGREILVTADDEGEFRMENLGEGIWILRATYEGFAMEEVRPLMLMQGREAEPQDLVLGDEYVIEGVVIDDQRRPVAGALVSVARTQPRPVLSSHATTREDGTFTVNHLQDGTYGLAVQVDGYANGRAGRVEANTRDLEIILQEKATVSGRISGPGGAVPDFTLEVFRTRRGNPTYGMTGVTYEFQGTDGSYTLENLDSGSYILLARAPGMAPTWSGAFMLQREDLLGIDIPMQLGGGIRGRVVDADGAPLGNAVISLHGNDYDPEQVDSLFGAALNDPNNVPKLEVRTGADGSFLMENAYLGGVQLFVQHQTHMPTLIPLEIREGQVNDTGDIQLYRGGTLFGVANGPNGAPLAGGTVNLNRQDGANFFNRTVTIDARGRYRFDALRAGTYELVAFPPTNESVFLFPPEGDKVSVYLREGEEKEVELNSSTQ